jgi:hypothetical protein
MSMFARLQAALEKAWSAETSSQWRPANPARGQCSVTALVVEDIMGGEIAKTDVDGAWHFYNLVDGKRLDFTQSQFREPPLYSDILSNREDAFTDTSLSQYRILRTGVLREMGRSIGPHNFLS